MLLLTACNKDSLSESQAGEGEGVLQLSYSLNTTRTDDLSEKLLENSTLRVSNSEGGLIRYYSPATEAPSQLYLVAGSYSISLSAGTTNYAATSTEECLFYGESPFEIVAGKSSSVDLVCTMKNSAVKIIYDSTIEENLEEGYTTYVSARDSFSLDEALLDETYTLTFTESGTGYFMLPIGVSNISWGFFGTHTDSEVGDLSATGVIEAPEAATLYSLTLKYSRTPDGYLEISATLDESTDDYDDNFTFSPQPSITALDLSLTESIDYAGASYNFNISAVNDLNSISIELLDIEGNVEQRVEPYASGTEVDTSAEGAIYTATSSTEGALTINSALFKQFTTGGSKMLSITATDIYNSAYTITPQFNIDGLIKNPTIDLWANSGVLECYIIEEQEQEVGISYRKLGDTEWVDAVAQKSGDRRYSIEIAPTWNTSTNAGGFTVYTLESGFRAGYTYEYKYSLAGVEQGQASFTTSGVQTLPNADMESTLLSCWTSTNGFSTSWCSGNNSMAESLCTQGTYSGMGGEACAVLSGASVTLVKIAAGNLALGRFEKSSTTSGTVSFGQPFDWESRPKTFKFKYAASIGTVDAAYHSGAPIAVGDQDVARIFFAVVDWDARHDVTAGTSSPTGVWDPVTMTSVDEGAIIGYAFQDITESTTGDMIESELEIFYYDTQTKPSKEISIVVSCSTSAYGDYMTGSTSSKLYVDDFELAY